MSIRKEENIVYLFLQQNITDYKTAQEASRMRPNKLQHFILHDRKQKLPEAARLKSPWALREFAEIK